MVSEGVIVSDSIHQALLLVYLTFPPRWSCCNTSLGMCKSFTGYLCFLRLILDLIICKPDSVLHASTLAGFPKKPAQWWEFRHYSGLWVSGLSGYYHPSFTYTWPTHFVVSFDNDFLLYQVLWLRYCQTFSIFLIKSLRMLKCHAYPKCNASLHRRIHFVSLVAHNFLFLQIHIM